MPRDKAFLDELPAPVWHDRCVSQLMEPDPRRGGSAARASATRRRPRVNR
jgi:hypothetical protein